MQAAPDDKLFDRMQARNEQVEGPARKILGALFQRYRPRSIVDVGCRIGTWLSVARADRFRGRLTEEAAIDIRTRTRADRRRASAIRATPAAHDVPARAAFESANAGGEASV